MNYSAGASIVFILYPGYVCDKSIHPSIHSFIYLSVCVCVCVSSLHSCCAARWSTTARRPRWPRSWACRSSPSPTTRPRGPSPCAPRRWPTCWSVGSALCPDRPTSNKHFILQKVACGFQLLVTSAGFQHFALIYIFFPSALMGQIWSNPPTNQRPGFTEVNVGTLLVSRPQISSLISSFSCDVNPEDGLLLLPVLLLQEVISLSLRFQNVSDLSGFISGVLSWAKPPSLICLGSGFAGEGGEQR